MKKGSQKLRKAILMILGSSALAGVSGQAQAFSAASLGTFTGDTITVSDAAPKKAFSDYAMSGLYPNSSNQGWMHTSNWRLLQIGSSADIAAGKTYDVQLKMLGAGSTILDNPSFAVWTFGTGSYSRVDNISHGWNPTRGPNDSTGWTGNTFIGNNAQGANGVIDGHDGWVGYVNSGATYTLTNWKDPITTNNQTGDGNRYDETVLGVSPGNTAHYGAADGVLNASSPWLTNPGSSGTFATALNSNGNDPANPDYAIMTLMGLKSGTYLIAAAGACPSGSSNGIALNACSAGQGYQFSVSTAPVPLPGAVWLFGSAVAGLIGIRRRKQI